MTENDTYNKDYKPQEEDDGFEEEVFYDEDNGKSYSLDLSWQGNNAWIWGVVLLVGGAVLLLQNFFGVTLIRLVNWWAVFILVPGLAMLNEAWHGYKENSTLSGHVRRRALGGFLLTGLAATFFFNLSWQILGPVFLIVLGVFLLVGKS